jgi:hypothetical protein
MTANAIISQLTAEWMIRRTDEPFLEGEDCARVLELPFMRDLLC